MRSVQPHIYAAARAVTRMKGDAAPKIHAGPKTRMLTKIIAKFDEKMNRNLCTYTVLHDTEGLFRVEAIIKI